MGKPKLHPIQEYLNQIDETQASFAGRAGMKPAHLNDVIKGRSRLGNGKVLAVAKATRGAVTAEQLLSWVAPKSRRRR